MPVLASACTISFDRRRAGLGRLFLPFALLRRAHESITRGRELLAGSEPEPPGPEPRRDLLRPEERAERARHEAATYLSERRSELRRDLQARR